MANRILDAQRAVNGNAVLGAQVAGAFVRADLQLSYSVLNAVRADLALSYPVLTAVRANLALGYQVLAAVRADLALSYQVLSDRTIVVPASRTVRFAGENRTVRF